MANIESSTGLYVHSENEKGKGDCTVFNEGEILYGKLRPYLNKVYLAEFDGGCSTEFLVLNSIDTIEITNKFLAIFLLLDCVVNQTKYMMTGNTLPRLQTFDLENLLIPIPSKTIQEEIIDIMENAYNSKKAKEEQAQKIINGIDDYLFDQLGIILPKDPKDTIENRTFKVGFSDIFNNRLDCLKYKPIYKMKIDSIHNSKYKNNVEILKSLIIHSSAGDWGEDENKILNINDYTRCLVLRATEFDNIYNIKIESSRKAYRFIKKEKLLKLDVKTNDILIEKSGGSPDQPVGRVALLSEDITNSNCLAYSNFVHKIRLNVKLNPEYTFNYLRAMYNKKITENMQSQTNGIRNLIMKEFLNIPIPVIDINIQNDIALEIRKRREKAKMLQKESKQELQKAKNEVEKIILGSDYES